MNKEEMLKNAISMLMTKGYKLKKDEENYITFTNWALSHTLKFDKRKLSYILFDTITGQAVNVKWGVQKAINELFKVYDYKTMGLIQYMCRELKLTTRQLADKINISISVIQKAEECVYSVTDSSLERIIDYAEQRGLEL